MCNRVVGAIVRVTLPAGSDFGLEPADSPEADAGMSNTVQWQNPTPVGASGSCMMTAKLFVPAGAPCHSTPRETFLPVQPRAPAELSAGSTPEVAVGRVTRNVAVAAFGSSSSPIVEAALGGGVPEAAGASAA